MINVDEAYELFMSTFLTLYDKHCPKKTFNNKYRHSEYTWMTKGLRNACKKKNNLYRIFIKVKTEESERKYKRYKNKLTRILRSCKKDYYCKKLEVNINNIKGIWNLLNSIIKCRKKAK